MCIINQTLLKWDCSENKEQPKLRNWETARDNKSTVIECQSVITEMWGISTRLTETGAPASLADLWLWRKWVDWVRIRLHPSRYWDLCKIQKAADTFLPLFDSFCCQAGWGNWSHFNSSAPAPLSIQPPGYKREWQQKLLDSSFQSPESQLLQTAMNS